MNARSYILISPFSSETLSRAVEYNIFFETLCETVHYVIIIKTNSVGRELGGRRPCLFKVQIVEILCDSELLPNILSPFPDPSLNHLLF